MVCLLAQQNKFKNATESNSIDLAERRRNKCGCDKHGRIIASQGEADWLAKAESYRLFFASSKIEASVCRLAVFERSIRNCCREGLVGKYLSVIILGNKEELELLTIEPDFH